MQALPRNGGEKNYLEYLVRRPKYLITALYAANGVLLGWASGNSVVFGDYLLSAGQVTDSGTWDWKPRLIGWAGLTFAMVLHGTQLKWGLRLLNVLGVIKVIIVLIVIITGFVALGGHLQVPKPNNFSHAFEGTTASASSFCLSLYNVIWSYIGFSNVNYALSEVKNPQKTVRVAGTLAIGIITVLYILSNIAYFGTLRMKAFHMILADTVSPQPQPLRRRSQPPAPS